MDLKNIYTKEFYDKTWQNGYIFANLIIPLLKFGIDIKSVIDIGCGAGGFLRSCLEQNIYISGVDGKHVKDSLVIPYEFLYFMDLVEIKFFKVHKKFDLLVTLEVIEHLDKSIEDDFIFSICKFSDNILFSGAQPGQEGINHINCQSIEHWKNKFLFQGFKYNSAITNIIRAMIGTIPEWYMRNAIFFEKIKK